MITREESTILKGFSILIIILTHFSGWIMPIGNYSSMCQAAVYIFLFMSGYGIICSYNNKGIKGFIIGRLEKIYVPFLIVSIPLFLLEVWKYHNNIGDMYIASTVLSVLGLYPCNLLDGTYWFISYIVLQYLFFWLAFKFCEDYKSKRVVWIILTVVGYIIFKKYFTWVNTNDIYAFAFLTGGLYSDFVNKIKVNNNTYTIVFVVCILVYITTIRWYDNVIARFVNCIVLAIVEIIIVKIIKSRLVLKLPILTFVGKISYEMYLTEGIFFTHKILYNIVGYNIIGLLTHLSVCIVLSIVIQKLTKAILNLKGEIINANKV